MNPNTTPLRSLPPAGAIQAIEELLDVARGLGLNVSPAIRPALWAEVLADHHFNELRAALIVYAGTKGSTWLNSPGEILARLPDRDAESWAKVEARLNTGNRELAPILDGREMLAIMDDQGIAWDYTHANHPIERAKVRERYLAALRRDRTHDPRIARLVQAGIDAGLPHALALEQVLAGPGLVVREEQVPLRQRQIEAALGSMCLAVVPARA